MCNTHKRRFFTVNDFDKVQIFMQLVQSLLWGQKCDLQVRCDAFLDLVTIDRGMVTAELLHLIAPCRSFIAALFVLFILCVSLNANWNWVFLFIFPKMSLIYPRKTFALSFALAESRKITCAFILLCLLYTYEIYTLDSLFRIIWICYVSSQIYRRWG